MNTGIGNSMHSKSNWVAFFQGLVILFLFLLLLLPVIEKWIHKPKVDQSHLIHQEQLNQTKKEE